MFNKKENPVEEQKEKKIEQDKQIEQTKEITKVLMSKEELELLQDESYINGYNDAINDRENKAKKDKIKIKKLDISSISNYSLLMEKTNDKLSEIIDFINKL